MQESYQQLLPIFLLFLLGVCLRKLKFAQQEQGTFLLKFMFFLTLPVLIFLKLTEVELNADSLLLPLAAIMVNSCCMLASLLFFKLTPLNNRQQGSILVSSMILNNAFLFPFILTVFGDQGFAYAVLLDFGGAVIASTLTYALAFKYSDEKHSHLALLGKPFRIPLVWAIILAIILNLMAVEIPEALQRSLTPLADMTAPLILIALGILFSTRLGHIKLVAATLFIRMGLGLAFGIAIAFVFRLEGLVFIIVALCSAAPTGFNSLTYSVLARLDVELASSIVSASILLGLFYVPLLMHILPGIAP